jgi:hypothetical protein
LLTFFGFEENFKSREGAKIANRLDALIGYCIKQETLVPHISEFKRSMSGEIGKNEFKDSALNLIPKANLLLNSMMRVDGKGGALDVYGYIK